MGVPFFEVHHTPKGGSSAEVYDCQSITIRSAIEAKANSMELKFSNRWAKNKSKFNEDDIVSVYAAWDGINTGNDLVMTAKIKEFKQQSDRNGRVLSPKGMDYTYLLLNKIYMPANQFLRGGGFTAPTSIKKIIDWISESENRSPNITTTNVQTTPTGGSTFDEIDLSLNLKSAYEWIQTLSADPYTRYDSATISDRTYLFWVDKDHDFHWIYPGQTKDFTFVFGQNNIISVNLKKSVFDVVNMVIYRAGDDPNGNGITWYFYDDRTQTQEIRIKIQPMVDIARDLLKSEKDFMDANSLAYDNSGYPDDYGAYRSAGGPTWRYNWSSGSKPNSDSDYLGGLIGGVENIGDGFRGACNFVARGRAAAITEQSAGLRWDGNIVIKGSTTYTAGQLMEFTFPDYNMLLQKLRVHEVVQNIGKGGWITTLSVKEDEEALVQ